MAAAGIADTPEGHCHVNGDSAPSGALPSQTGGKQQARLALPDPELPATDEAFTMAPPLFFSKAGIACFIESNTLFTLASKKCV